MSPDSHATGPDRQSVAKAAALDLLRRGMNISELPEIVGYSRRTIQGWKRTDPEFGRLADDAMKNKGRVVTEGKVGDWTKQLGDLEARIAGIEADLLQIAAPALAGDEQAQNRQAELRAQVQPAREAAEALRQAIASAEQHLERARAEEAEADRQQAASTADALQATQIAAAQRIDAALREVEEAWQQFSAASADRSVAARRAGGRARPAFTRMLVQAVFACAPNAATALRLDRVLRPRSRPLAETVAS